MPSKRDDDPEAHTRRDPEASSSQRPELPLAGGDESDEEGPPGIEESDGESTVDYRNFDDNFRDFEDDQVEDYDEDWFAVDAEEFFLSTADVPSTNA